MDDLMSESMASRNLPSLLLGTFAVLALLLSSVGIYGVVAYSVMRRTREIGIRMALGADRGRVFRMIVAQGVEMAGADWVSARWLQLRSCTCAELLSSALWGRQERPTTLLEVLSLLLLAALIACYVPTRRAMRTDPTNSLRCE